MIIGLLGFKGSGKGTVGEILIKRGFHQLSFASPVKDITSVMFNWPRNLLEGNTEESRIFREKPDEFWSKQFGEEFSPRKALQLIGTEVGRNVFHTDFWIIKMRQQLQDNTKNYVITDVRFPNELKMLRELGAIFICVQRGLSPHWYDIAAKANRGDVSAEKFMKERIQVHESEWRWIQKDEFDYVIENNNTVEDLERQTIYCLTNSFGSNMMSEILEGAL